MEKHKKVPVLRFPEFKGEWEVKKIGSITERVSNPVEVEEDTLYQQIGIRSHGKGIFHKELVDGKSLGNKRVFWVQKDVFIVNIVFAWEQAVAKTSSREVGMVASHRFPMYSPLANKSDLNYLLYFFLTKKGKTLLELASPGGAGRNKTLGQKAFEHLGFLIPVLSEQTKIANFFTSIFDKIEALKHKKSLLEQYKQGVMQKIFSQELRFKDDNNRPFPKWEKKRLSEVLSLPEKIKPNVVDRDRLLTVKLHLKGIFRNENTDNLSLGATYYIRKKGQFIYGKQNLFNGAFAIIPNKFDGYLSSGDVPALDINYDKVDSKYLFYFLGREGFYKKLEEISSGSGSKRIHEKILLNVEIHLPKLSEQIIIANFISSLDKKIEQCTSQLDKTEQYKKGLFQKMFC